MTESGNLVLRNPNKPFFEGETSDFYRKEGVVSKGKRNPGGRGRRPLSQVEENPFFEKDNSGQFSDAQTHSNTTPGQFNQRLELPVIPGGFSRLTVKNPGGIPLTDGQCPNCGTGLKIAPGVTGGTCICGAKLQINPALAEHR